MTRQKYMIDNVNKVRECGRCREVKPFQDFPFNDDGRPKSYCLICKNNYANEWNKKQREKRREMK